MTNETGVAPLVTVVIVHFDEEEYLQTCVNSILASTHSHIECIVVDNGKHCLAWLKEQNVVLIKNKANLHFAASCNIGIQQAKGEYVFVMNDDIEVEPDCIARLLRVARQHPEAGICSPKMLDYYQRSVFHSSAAGGALDVLGYPFARGRVFDTVETDSGQYATPQLLEVFWGSGAALFARKDIVAQAGLFDPDFLFYMEEIDLCWRVHLLGYTIFYVPDARIYHIGGVNLKRKDMFRMYLLHRNSLIMMLKNYGWQALMLLFPIRLLIELVTLGLAMLTFRSNRVLAIARTFQYIARHFRSIAAKRRAIQRKRKVDDQAIFRQMYKSSVLVHYYLLRQKKYDQIKV